MKTTRITSFYLIKLRLCYRDKKIWESKWVIFLDLRSKKTSAQWKYSLREQTSACLHLAHKPQRELTSMNPSWLPDHGPAAPPQPACISTITVNIIQFAAVGLFLALSPCDCLELGWLFFFVLFFYESIHVKPHAYVQKFSHILPELICTGDITEQIIWAIRKTKDTVIIITQNNLFDSKEKLID